MAVPRLKPNPATHVAHESRPEPLPHVAQTGNAARCQRRRQKAGQSVKQANRERMREARAAKPKP